MLSSRSLKCLALPVLLLVGACDRQAEPQGQQEAAGAKVLSGTLDRSHAGKPMPAFTLEDAAGRTLELASLNGQPVLMNLWATWCAPCVVELPMLDTLAGDMEGELRVLTVSQDMQDTDKVADFLTERGGERLEPWLDTKSDLTFKLEAQTLPTTILYDAEGEEVWRYVGGHDWSGAAARELIAEGL